MSLYGMQREIEQQIASLTLPLHDWLFFFFCGIYWLYLIQARLIPSSDGSLHDSNLKKPVSRFDARDVVCSKCFEPIKITICIIFT